MIDPFDITRFDRDKHELQELVLFCCMVAGKKATMQAQALDRFLQGRRPFRWIKKLKRKNRLRDYMVKARIGQYTRLERCFDQLAHSNFDLKTVSVEALESIHGIGPKTSRFFVLHSRPNARVACLDRHVLRWLIDRGHDVLDVTPTSNRRYHEIERIFLNEADSLGIDPHVLDLDIWKAGAKDEQK